MNGRSKSPPAGAGRPGSFLRAASRSVVEHTGLAALLTVVLVIALCIGRWWLAYRHALDWDANHDGQPVPFRLFAIVGWMLTIGAGSWLGLLNLSDKRTQRLSTLGNVSWWSFDARRRARIFEGRPISPKFLWIHGLFGLLGFAFGVALALRLAAAAGWQDQVLSRDKGPLALIVLAIIVMALAAGRIRDVLFLHHYGHFVGDEARKLAQTVAEEEQAEAEAEREYERKTVTGGPLLILIGGFFGGVYLASRWLPVADGNTAGQASASGLIVGVTAVYVLKRKPRGWVFWLGLAFAVAVGFLVFTNQTWHSSLLYLLLGTLWGAGIGVTATLLYLRKLRGN